MKRKSITKNYIYNLIYQILVLILPLITAPYVSRVLGAEKIGIYSYTLSISAYFILFGSLGISLYGQREIAYKQKDKKEYSKIFFEIVILRALTMLISLLIFYFVCIIKENNYKIYYKILVLEIIGNCLDISWLFQGLEDFKKIVSRNIFIKLISIICIFLFVKTPDDLYIYFLIYVLSVLIGNASLWLYLSKYIEKCKIRELKVFRHLKPTIALFIPQIAVQVYTLLDKTMIGTIISDKSEVGYYEQSQKIVKMSLTVITSLGTVMLPRIASCFSTGDKDKISDYMHKSFNVVFLLAFPMMFGLLAISDKFVPVFFGEGYEKVSLLIKIISPIILLIGLSNIIGNQYLLPGKKQKQYTLSVIGGAIVNIIMNSFLINIYGAIGAAIGTVIAEFTVTTIQILYTRKDFNWKEILRLPIGYIISSLIMFLICFFVGKIMGDGLLSVVLQVIIGIVVYALMLLRLKDAFAIETLNRVKSKLKRQEGK